MSALKKLIDALKQSHYGNISFRTIRTADAELAQMQAVIEAAKDYVNNRHDITCNVDNDGAVCDCGYDDLVVTLEKLDATHLDAHPRT